MATKKPATQAADPNETEFDRSERAFDEMGQDAAIVRRANISNGMSRDAIKERVLAAGGYTPAE